MTPQQFTQSNYVHFEQELWKNELDTIDQENKAFLDLLTELQREQLIKAKYQPKIVIFFEQFQYFSYLTRRLKEGLGILEKEVSVSVENEDMPDSKYYGYLVSLKEEKDGLEKKYQTFKTNFKSFVSNVIDVTTKPEVGRLY